MNLVHDIFSAFFWAGSDSPFIQFMKLRKSIGRNFEVSSPKINADNILRGIHCPTFLNLRFLIYFLRDSL